MPAIRPAAIHRHPGDLLRVGLSIAVLGLAFLVARRGELSVFEIDVLRLVNDLPALIYVPVWAVMQLGNASSGGRWAAVQATTGTGRRGTAEAPVLLRLGWAPISATPVPQTGRPSVTDTIDAMESPWE